MRRKLYATTAVAALSLVLTACGGDAASDTAATSGSDGGSDYPSEDLDWTIAFGPGGGNDIMARTMVDILREQDLYPENIVVQNREGGSGATGWGYLYSQAGSGYGVSTTSGSFITTPLQADTGWTPDEFTPVGLFATDDALVLVKGDSEVKTWEDWVASAKEKGRVVVGGIGTVNVDFIVASMLAEQAGYEMEYVPFNEEGQLQTSLLSGAVDAMISNPGSILGQVEAGEMTPLITTSDERLAALPEVPTDESLGFEGIPSMPRGLILPPDAPQEAQDWWIETMKEVVRTPEWQEYLDTNYLSEDVRWGEDFEQYLLETQAQFKEILEEQGAL